MKHVCLHAREEIERFLRRDPYLHLYALGDLDDFFWPYTTWYGWSGEPGEPFSDLALVYSGTSLPVLLGLSRDPGRMGALLLAIRPFLPRRFYAHTTGRAVRVLASAGEAPSGAAGAIGTVAVPGARIESHGRHLRMAWREPDRVREVDLTDAFVLQEADTEELLAFYRASYPGNWFDRRMLHTGFYFGLRRDGRLASVAGVHVVSRRYRVAALGNIATHPEYRGRGLAGIVTAALCRSLREHADHVGLNVRADNESAVACYTRLGFAPVAEYDESMIETTG